MAAAEEHAYQILGVPHEATDAEIKKERTEHCGATAAPAAVAAAHERSLVQIISYLLSHMRRPTASSP